MLTKPSAYHPQTIPETPAPRRAFLIDTLRLFLLRLRVQIGRPLPVVLMAALRTLDKWSATRVER